MRRHTRAALSTLLLASIGAPGAVPPLAGQQTRPPDYDVVLRGGRVVDGSGSPWVRADVAVRNGRIVRVGRVDGSGRTEIDARGRYVTPGFIDMMDQSGGALLRNGNAETKLLQGVTTLIAGEGGTPVPADSVGVYFRTLEERGISPNFGSYFSEGQARRAVLGAEDRRPTPAEMEEMKAILDEAMRQGTLGMTTALIYPPGSYAETEELVEMATVAARHGGTYASHIRGEGKELVEAVREAIEIGERAGLPVEIFHFKAAFEPGWGTLIREAAAAIDAARARGVDVAADLYPYTAGGTGLDATIPSWAHEGGGDSLRARIARPEVRERLKRELETGSEGWWNIVEASGGWDRIVVVNTRDSATAHLRGMSVEAIANELGKEPADAAWDLVGAARGRVSTIYHMMSEEDVAWALTLPWTSVGSDAGASVDPSADAERLPHPRTYGTFPRILARYVRDQGVLPLEEAVRKMTGWPAIRMRLPRRGLVREGSWADLVVFDLDEVQDHATFEEPARFSSGIDWVLVNGRIVVAEGEHTGARPGHVIRGPGAGG